MKFTFLSVLAVVCAFSCWAVPAAEPEKISLLFMHGSVSEKQPGEEHIVGMTSFLPDERLQRQFTEQNMVWGASYFSTKLTLDYLRQFNAVLLMDFPMIERHDTVKAEIREMEKLLAQYVAEGGGLLLTGTTSYSMWGMERNIEEMNRFLEPFGARVVSEQVGEKNHLLTLPTRGASQLAWTGNVVKHPLTEGVRGLLYPTDFSWSYWTRPLAVNPPWEVLLKGSATAYSYTVKLGASSATASSNKVAGTVATEPALLAVRGSGQGRMALWPVVPSAYITDAYHPFWGSGLTMEGTHPEMPSDGRVLLFNLIRWLTEPSRGKFGGYEPKPFKGLDDEVGFRKIDWDKLVLSRNEITNCYRGLIGLKSKLSTGADTPADMIAAARAAGYQFAAFTEDLEKLTPESLGELIHICGKSSDTAFQVYPGFTYHDASGNAWVTFGRQIHWPKDDWWADQTAKTILKNNMIFRGFQFKPVIMLHPNRNPEPAWFQGNFKGMAVITTQAGKMLDDAEDVYVKLQENGYNLFPVVVHEVRSAAEVQAAAAIPWQSQVRWFELEDVIGAYSGTTAMYKGNYIYQRNAFISTGPVIEDFQVCNFGHSDLAIPGGDRFRLRLRVSSPRGLKEILIRDGHQMWRRIALNGEKEKTVELDGWHDRAHHFLVTVTDAAGGRTISPVRWTNVQEMLLIRCSDNLNTYFSGKFRGLPNNHALRGLESYIDRQAGNCFYFPQISEVPEMRRFAVDQQLTLASRFGYIKTDGLDCFYPPDASPNWNLNDLPQLARSQTAMKGKVVTTMFTPRSDSTVVWLVEGDMTTLKDLPAPNNRLSLLRLNWAKDANVLYVAEKKGGSLCARLDQRKCSYSGLLADAEYVANLAPPGGSRAVIPLQPDLSYSASHSERTLLAIQLVTKQSVLPQNTPVTWQYLAVWSKINPVPDNGFIEEIMAKMGFRGKPAYTLRLTGGEVLDSQFILRLKAQDYGVAGTVTEAKLPMDLPVFVEGLNERWPAGILYKGKNRLLLPEWKISAVGSRCSEQVERAGENQLFRFPVLNGRGMLQLNTEFGDKTFFMGNLLVCDQPELFLALDDIRPGKARITINNPLDREVTVTVKPGPGFDLLGQFEKKIRIPAGSLVSFSPAGK